MKALVVLLFLCATANAAEVTVEAFKQDPRFSFAGAETAFQSAVSPSQDLLLGDWMLVGAANAPGVGDNHVSGYFPDGKHKIPGFAGFFRSIVEMSSFEDSFGGMSLGFTEKIYGVESGKLRNKVGPHLGAMREKGAVFNEPSTESVCGNTVECRLVVAKQMLLCAITSVDKRRSCSHLPDTVARYLGLTKIQH